MAWYAELRRRDWYCIMGMDMVYEYRRECYENWYASLTDDQRQELKERHERREAEKQEKFRRTLFGLMSPFLILSGITRPTTGPYGSDDPEP